MRAHGWQPLPHPPTLTEFPFTVLVRRLPGDMRATAAQRTEYLKATRMGDPEADALVGMFRRLPPGQGRKLFDLAVDNGIAAVEDPPPELVAFFDSVDAVPFWLDPQQLDLAARVIGRSGMIGDIALSMGALLGGYCAHRVVKTLVGTNDLDRMAPRRVAETMHWYTEVTAPGGLDRFAQGFRLTLRVRLMHALVRAGMSRRPDWNWEAWDHPVNQSQLVGTTVFFSVSQIAGSQALGMHWSRDEKAAVYHFFRYVGYLLGVRADLLPATERDYWKLFWLQIDYEFRAPDADSIRLAQALIRTIGLLVIGDQDDLPHRVGRNVATGVFCGYARMILGRSTADFLGLPDSRAFRTLVVVAAAGITGLEAVRRAIPGATQVCEKHGRRTKANSVARMMVRHRGDYRLARDGHPTHPAAEPDQPPVGTLTPSQRSASELPPLTPPPPHQRRAASMEIS